MRRISESSDSSGVVSPLTTWPKSLPAHLYTISDHPASSCVLPSHNRHYTPKTPFSCAENQAAGPGAAELPDEEASGALKP